MRARNIKPGIFKNEHLAILGSDAFRLFTGLWCMADRQGRLKDEPGKIEAELFPFKFQRIKIEELMEGLCSGEDPFLIRYEASGQKCLQIKNFLDHQRPHPKEVPSMIPPCRKKLSPRLEQDITQNSINPSGSSLSSDVQDLLIPDTKTPSADAGSNFWKDLIRHINDSWSRKKQGAKYLWNGKDFAALKRMLRAYEPADVMALWDLFISSDDDFAKRQGYCVPEFVRQIPRLVDGNWKGAAKKYLDKLMPINPENIVKINDLLAKATAGKDIR